MAITAQEVNKLRQATGAGMMDCKEALKESDGDFDAALDHLRKKGQKVSAKRSDKEAREGIIFTKTSEDGKKAVLIALNCETDFVAKNEEFKQIGQKIADAAFEQQPASLDELNSVEIEGKTIATHLTDLVGKIGEKIEIGDYHILQGELVIPYVHSTGKIGVLTALKGINGADAGEIGKDIAMQIAAMKPVALDKDGVPQDIIEKEMEYGREQARAEGKPDNIIEKIAEGKLNKFYKEGTLLNQAFVKDSSKTVSEALEDVQKGLTVADYKRVEIG